VADGASSITAPIASATSVEQLNELAQATKLELDRESMEKLNKASAYDSRQSGSRKSIRRRCRG